MGTYLVIGVGRFGSAVATELYLMNHDVLVVDKNEERVTGITNQVTNIVIGDSKDEAVLRSLGIHNFDCVVVAIASALEDSVLTTIMLKEMEAKMLVCKAQNEWHAKILSQLGADKVIRPEYDTGKRVAHSLVQENIIDYLELSPDYSILELHTPAHWVNKTIGAIDLRKKYGIKVFAIRSAKTDKLTLSLDAQTLLYEGDILTLVGPKQNLDKINALK